MNGYSHGARSAGPDASRGSDGAGDARPGGHSPPMAEIAASVTDKVNELRQAPIGRILELGKSYFSQAKTMLNSRSSPAGAYWAYLVAFQLVCDVIPRHPGYYDRIVGSRGQMHHDFTSLSRDVGAYEERFLRIKEIIINDNKRNGIHPRRTSDPARSVTREPHPESSRGPSQNGQQVDDGSLRRDDELMLPDTPAGPPLHRGPADTARRKPPVQPKPQALHGRAVHQNSTAASSTDTGDLTERFAKLRGIAAPVESTSSQDLSVKMPSPSDYASSDRPSGPRDMPALPLPLNTGIASALPKEPSPTYSPARNLTLPAHINPPRSTARSMVGSDRASSMTASSASNYHPQSNGHSDSYFPTPPTTNGSTTSRRQSVGRPAELQITADRLYDYIRMYNVLIMDVRSRADFDSGHIFVHSIMCVEPASLHEGSSAEQLQDRLVISPDEEQAMYDRRNEYDLVVYYDQSTRTNSFLHKYAVNEEELVLKRLYETLHEFNREKPLKRPPILLMGGIDAWADLVGHQGLQMSRTAGLAPGSGTRSRALRRSPAVAHATRQMQARRKREYISMDPEEQRQWLEEARRGRAVVEELHEDEEEELASPMYRTTEDFLRRYPDIEEQQSMVHPPSRPHAEPQYVPPPIPAAPSRPPPSLPRTSYSGVHERQLARQTSGTQTSIYTSPGRYGPGRFHRTGLVNFGSTCYMNAVVQCLSANPELSSNFLTGRYAHDLQKDNWKGTKGILPEAYATLLSNMYKGDTPAIRPSTLRKVCGLFNSNWARDQQQDAKEFLGFFLEALHEDLNTTWSKPVLAALSDAQEQARERLPRPYAARIEWGRYLHREQSLIGGLFAGQHASRLTCVTCGTTSTTYEPFWSISVEIPSDRACDVRDCLRSYCATERLGTEDSWRCPRCKQPREAMKKITITRAPDSLVLHFKRFSAHMGETARKIRTPIQFPLQRLDMGPFMEAPLTQDQERLLLRERDGAAQLAGLKTDPAMNGPYLYNAYAVIWHIGSTLGSGHYTAWVKDRAKGCWRYFDDDRARDLEPGRLAEGEKLQNERAYVVFYERERVASGVL